MDKKYRLLPEQVENLRRLYADNLVKLSKANATTNLELQDRKAATGQELNVGIDTSLLGMLSVASKNYNSAKEQLENYELIEPNNSDIIGLGSTFEVCMNYGDFEETETLTLVEVRNSYDSDDFVSINSPLGRAAHGHKVGEQISYTVEQRTITGIITDIIKQKTL